MVAASPYTQVIQAYFAGDVKHVGVMYANTTANRDPFVASEPHRLAVLCDAQLTAHQAQALERVLNAPSTLSPDFAPLVLPQGDRSVLMPRVR